jgi:hypothetical protein
MKYTAIALLFAVSDYRALYVAGVAIIPIPRVIEYASKRRFRLPWIGCAVGGLDAFRVRYYLTGVIGSAMCGWLGKPYARLCLILMMYMLVFRVIALAAASKLRGGNGHCAAPDKAVAA